MANDDLQEALAEIQHVIGNLVARFSSFQIVKQSFSEKEFLSEFRSTEKEFKTQLAGLLDKYRQNKLFFDFLKQIEKAYEKVRFNDDDSIQELVDIYDVLIKNLRQKTKKELQKAVS